MLPAGGWLVIAFPTDNPGAWLMHCHIVRLSFCIPFSKPRKGLIEIQAWHIGEGLGVQFLESKDNIPTVPADYQSTCDAWKSYYHGNPLYLQEDSGL